MNTASQNLPHHLGVLRERLLHPTDYERALHYFLEEFGGDIAFVRASEPEEAPHLVAVLGHIASRALGNQLEIENATVSQLREHQFYHGNAQAGGRVVLFFYFKEADVGLMALIPGARGEMDIARFRLNGIADPRTN